MPDTTPEHPVIGVNVQHRDGSLHAIAAGRDWRFDDDALHVLNGTAPGSRIIAVFAPGRWDLVELVHGEAEPPPPPAPTITTPGPAVSVSWTPQGTVTTTNTDDERRAASENRVRAAQQAVADGQRATVAAARELNDALVESRQWFDLGGAA